jgi:ubiquinone/menaquinone biosynthesis C-methylase UbiE
VDFDYQSDIFNPLPRKERNLLAMSEAIYRNTGVYLNEDHHNFVKENFKVLGDLISNRAKEVPESANVLDVGCATGALIGYLSKRFSNYAFTGVDNVPELLEVARTKIPGSSWYQGNAFNLPSDFAQNFDLSLLIGVLSVFDEKDARNTLLELIRCTRKGGYIYIFSPFNEHDVDILVTHRKYKNDAPSLWEKGWNLYSERTVKSWIKDNVSHCKITPFNMPFDLEPKDDPIRTWTIKTDGSKRRQTNGLKFLVDFSFLEIKV